MARARPSGRAGDRLRRRRRRQPARRRRRRGRLDAAAARGRRAAGHGDRGQQRARYAATDLATEDHRARALSTVVWATTIGAVPGPTSPARPAPSRRRSGIPVLTGPFALGCGRHADRRPSWSGCGCARTRCCWPARPPGCLRPSRAARADGRRAASWRRALAAVRERPVLGWAIAGLAGAHAAMIGVMVMTPLHMEHGGAEPADHRRRDQRPRARDVRVLAAWSGGSPTGSGGRSVLGTGGVVLLCRSVSVRGSPEGSSVVIFAGLFLLGLGWSCATVAASTLIADHAPLEARTEVQGTSDLVMGLTAASAGGLAGFVTGAFGYPTLAVCTVALALLVVLAAAPGRTARPVSATPIWLLSPHEASPLPVVRRRPPRARRGGRRRQRLRRRQDRVGADQGQQHRGQRHQEPEPDRQRDEVRVDPGPRS